ncbi:Hsp20/alpha crystallin family protein [candidate division WS5 bacterium]|uniref:Hsp20/alpha crystallin family protein n=1 Tax=candidate division WS5 bacterium TaxID=2093353 RepID=A0A419DFK6_9BACT|nr:MAG: Hsp20/alpha crystallin family protein [candidate division WS5 bacterium]
MAIIRWRPFDVGQFLTEDMPTIKVPRFIGDLAVDVYEKGGNVVAEMGLPNIDPKSLNITVEDSYIRIAGHREETKEEEKKNYYYKEIQRGSFERTVRLPVPVKKEKADAKYEDGMLTITIPKIEEKKAKVKIKSKKKPALKVARKSPARRTPKKK